MGAEKEFRRRLMIVLLLAMLVWVASALLGAGIVGEIIAALMLTTSVYLIARMYRRQKQMLEQLTLMSRRNESALNLCATLPLRAPLPPAGGWAASADLLCLLETTILREKPEVIVEASSGISTLVCAYCLEKTGRGKVISLEHDAEFARRSAEQLKAHSLGHIAEVAVAPLVPHEIGGARWLWYDTSALASIDRIDLIFIDGPPGDIQPEARYPALPLLWPRLKTGGIVLLDDADREQEREIVARWRREFGDSLQAEHIPLEKGAYVFRKK